MTLTITSSEEEVYPPIFEYDVLNPDDFGPGAVLHGRSPDAKLQKLNATTHFDAKDLIARLASEARAQASVQWRPDHLSVHIDRNGNRLPGLRPRFHGAVSGCLGLHHQPDLQGRHLSVEAHVTL